MLIKNGKEVGYIHIADDNGKCLVSINEDGSIHNGTTNLEIQVKYKKKGVLALDENFYNSVAGILEWGSKTIENGMSSKEVRLLVSNVIQKLVVDTLKTGAIKKEAILLQESFSGRVDKVEESQQCDDTPPKEENWDGVMESLLIIEDAIDMLKDIKGCSEMYKLAYRHSNKIREELRKKGL